MFQIKPNTTTTVQQGRDAPSAVNTKPFYSTHLTVKPTLNTADSSQSTRSWRHPDPTVWLTSALEEPALRLLLRFCGNWDFKCQEGKRSAAAALWDYFNLTSIKKNHKVIALYVIFDKSLSERWWIIISVGSPHKKDCYLNRPIFVQINKLNCWRLMNSIN